MSNFMIDTLHQILLGWWNREGWEGPSEGG